MSSLLKASKMLEALAGESFAGSVRQIEESFVDASKETAVSILAARSLDHDLLNAAREIKKNASRINETIHALGILLALPKVLMKNERVKSLSLAAGNTGKRFDLVTDKRIAEFTFIQWQGGAEVIRQNKIFKDFYFLAEEETSMLRELYVLGTEHALNFFNGSRSIRQILDGNAKLGRSFRDRYGDRFCLVQDYFRTKKDVVRIRDVKPLLAPCYKS